jgi:serine/threonine-protein kinase RsbW
MNSAVLEHTRHFTAPARAAQIRHLRHRLAKTLADWGVTQRSDDVLCSCSELLTNALIYGQTDQLTVDLTMQDGWLQLTVPDNNPVPPYPMVANRDEEDGRGVFLVAALADAWGFRSRDGGKHVFAQFRISDHTPAHPATMAPGDQPTTPL